MNYIGDITNEMQRWYSIINEKKFDSQLPQAIITIQQARSNNYGHCTRERIWTNENKDDSYYEININASTLHREVIDIIGTIYHEILHEYHNVNGIRGCNGNIHNKKFKALAESHGFRIEKSKQYGFGHTFVDPNTELMRFIVDEIKPDAEIFKYARIVGDAKPTKTREKKTFKYVCKNCGAEAKAKAEANLICGECDMNMEMEE